MTQQNEGGGGVVDAHTCARSLTLWRIINAQVTHFFKEPFNSGLLWTHSDANVRIAPHASVYDLIEKSDAEMKV